MIPALTAALRRFGSHVFIFVTIVVDLLGYGIVIPLLPLFVSRLAEGGTVVGLLGAGYALAQALGGPVLAGLSDRFGRKPLLLACVAGTALAYLLLGLADSLWLLVIAILLDGLTGGNLSIAQAYVADTTPPEDRAGAFGLIGAAFGLGMLAGPALGGALSTTGLSSAAFAAAGLATVNLVFGLLVLPESLPPGRRGVPSAAAFNPLSQLAGLLSLPGIRGLLLAVFLLNLAFAGLQSNFPLFSGVRFGWDSRANASFYAFVGLCAVVTQAVLLGALRRVLSLHHLALAGMVLMATNLALMGLASQAWMLFPVVAALALGSNLSIPCLTALLSAAVGPERQGRLMGGLQTVLNAALVGGPLLAGLVFDYVDVSAPYLVGALIALSALGVLVRVRAN